MFSLILWIMLGCVYFRAMYLIVYEAAKKAIEDSKKECK